MEVCQVSIKIEGDEPDKSGGLMVGVKEEEQQESDVNGAEVPKSAWLLCRQCGAAFGDGRAGRRHMRLSHPEEYQEQVLACSRLRCHLCGLPCSSSRQLIEHQRSQHPVGRPFQCPVCGDSFIQSHALINHQRRHVHQSRYACRDCPHTSRSLAQLLAHRRTHALPRPLPPAHPAAVAAEEPQQTPTSSLQCPQCFITFQDLQTSQQHMRLKHSALYWQQLRGCTVFACRRCDRTFPSSRQLSAHQRAHLQGQGAEDVEEEEELRKSAPDAQPPSPCPRVLSEQHKCPYCNFLFRDAKTKLRHMNAKHPPGCTPPPPLLLTAADSGGEGEGEEKAMMAVQIKKEEEEELEKCEEDDPCAAPGPALDGHPQLLNGGTEGDEDEGGVVKVRIKLDPGEEEGEERVSAPSPSPPPPCECALCGKGFEQMVAVAGQRRRGRRRDHPSLLGPRGHVCRHCGQLCHSREELQQHQRLHTDERPYHCQHCGNTFKKASGLRRHKSVHSQLLRTVTTPTPASPSLQSRVPTSTSQTHCDCTIQSVISYQLQQREELGEGQELSFS